MKIFAIKNEYENLEPTAFLIYYEISDKYYIEIIDGIDEWTVPFFLSSFVKKGIYTVDSGFSYDWVRQRIVPTDRQNIGQILRDNNLSSYNEYELLLLASGRCAQDDYCLVEIKHDDLPKCILNRFKKKIDDIIPLSGTFSLLIFFNDKKVKKCDMRPLINNNSALKNYLSQYPDRFKDVKVDVGGYGVSWNDNMIISNTQLYKSGKTVPLSKEDFIEYVSERIVNTAQAADIIGCSRQNIDDLVKRGKLNPVKINAKDKLFLKSDVQKRKWN